MCNFHRHSLEIRRIMLQTLSHFFLDTVQYILYIFTHFPLSLRNIRILSNRIPDLFASFFIYLLFRSLILYCIILVVCIFLHQRQTILYYPKLWTKRKLGCTCSYNMISCYFLLFCNCPV